MSDTYRRDPGVALMLAYQTGDEGAFDRLVESYSPQVFALVTRFLGMHPAREDMVQEVFLRVIRARDRYEPTARFSTFLYRIVFNLCVNETQRAGAKETRSIDEPLSRSRDDGSRYDLADAGAVDPSSGMERDDVVREVRAAIAGLPESQRMALILAKYHEMPYAEIAEVMESTEKAIKSLIHRGREKLRATLSALIEEELA